jgi:ubiquitin-protein ligase
MGGVRAARLKSEFEAMQNFSSDVLRWEAIGKKIPPDHYRLLYDLTSISGMEPNDTPQIVRKVWMVEVLLPPNYPWGKPEVRFVGDQILHPNVWVNGDVCIEDKYQAGIGIPLDSLCEHIGQIIAYQKCNLNSPANANKDLQLWIRSQSNQQLPTDSRQIRLSRIEFGKDPPRA